MRIINVIVTTENGVESIESFGIFEEQTGQDVIDKAEKFYLNKIKSVGIECDEEEDEDEFLGNGYAENKTGTIVAIVWSSI